MNDWKKFYVESLYPFQNGVLNCVRSSEVRFFLTGGTALSRGYFNHRFSDDLDFFIENDSEFRSQTDKVMSAFQSSGYVISSGDFLISEDFISLFLESRLYPEVRLKIDFVNDVAKRFGAITETDVYYRTDDWSNILSNKLCALLRLEAKDFADIWVIAENRKFNWDRILNEAREKEMGLDPYVLAGLLKSIPKDRFDAVKWIEQPSWDEFMSDIERIVYDLLRGKDNSLCL